MTNNPTPQQIDRDLAEKVMGWEVVQGNDCLVLYPPNENRILVIADKPVPVGCVILPVFSPSTSRDDCAEVLAKVPPEKRRDVCKWLRAAVWDAEPEESAEDTAWMLLTATPAQIAEAVWRAACQ